MLGLFIGLGCGGETSQAAPDAAPGVDDPDATPMADGPDAVPMYILPLFQDAGLLFSMPETAASTDGGPAAEKVWDGYDAGFCFPPQSSDGAGTLAECPCLHTSDQPVHERQCSNEGRENLR